MKRFLATLALFFALAIPAAATEVVSSAAEGSHVICSAACRLYHLSVTTGASAGYVLIYDATSAPVDGAVTPALCYTAGASSTLGVSFGDIPADFAVGLAVVFSTGASCFAQTTSSTAYFATVVKP